MVVDMNEAQVHTVELVRQVLEGTQVFEFRRADYDEGRYGWIDAVLRRFDYRQLRRGERAPALAYLRRLSGHSRAQVTRLVSRWYRASRWSNATRPRARLRAAPSAAELALPNPPRSPGFGSMK